MSYPNPSVLFGSSGQYLVFWTRGDSIAAGTSSSVGPTTTTGKIYEWVGSTATLVDRATTEFSSVTSGVAGSIWKQFAIDVNLATGKKVVIIAQGLSGAEVFPNGTGTNTHWAPHYDTSGASVPAGTGSTLYNTGKGYVAACLAALGKARLDGVLDVVGINDTRGPATMANVYLGFDSLYDKTNEDFPGVPCYVAGIGRDETNTIDQRKQQLKSKQRQMAEARSYYHIVANLISLYAWDSSTYYGADNLHLTQAGNNLVGSFFARYFLGTDTNKEVKQLLNAFKTPRTTAHAAAWRTWVTNLQSAGIYQYIDAFIPAVGSAKEDVLIDVRYIGFGLDSGFTFTANSHIACGGSNYRRFMIIPEYGGVASNGTNFAFGTKIKQNNTAAGTVGYLSGMGQASPTRNTITAQSVSSTIVYGAADGTTTTYTGQTRFNNNKLYTVVRDGTTKALYIDGVSVHSASVAVAASPMTISPYEGCRNNAGAANGPLDCELEYSYYAGFTGNNLLTLYNECETLLTALRIP